MSAKGAIAAGRRLNNQFADYLPCAYNYPGNDKDSESGISDSEMISREMWILSKWLELKGYRDILEQGNIQTVFEHISAEIRKTWG
ncbi:MAG: hypothetical protein K0R08_1470 [Solimicrobium sp.]|nr:hypothetical protein [Solimicrobium sp.]